jgi:hypothetical protein
MLVLHQLLYVLFTLRGIFMHFFGTNLLIRCHRVPVFCCFCISEKLFWKYSWNWTKQSPRFLFFCHVHGVQRRPRGGHRGGHAMPWHGPAPGRAWLWCGPLGRPPTSPFRLYIAPNAKTLNREASIHEKVPQRRRHRRQVSGDRSLCSGTLPGRGIAPGAISIDSTAIFIVVADSHDEEGVVLL